VRCSASRFERARASPTERAGRRQACSNEPLGCGGEKLEVVGIVVLEVPDGLATDISSPHLVPATVGQSSTASASFALVGGMRSCPWAISHL
jgi:hypothetical protein